MLLRTTLLDILPSNFEGKTCVTHSKGNLPSKFEKNVGITHWWYYPQRSCRYEAPVRVKPSEIKNIGITLNFSAWWLCPQIKIFEGYTLVFVSKG